MATKKYTEEEARQRKNARQREYAKKTGYAANAKYLKENTKRYVINVGKKTEQDIYEKLEEEENKAGYIKKLIRADIAGNNKKDIDT